MSCLKSAGGALLTGGGVIALGLLSYLIGWGFFKGIAAGLLAMLLVWLIRRAK